jgi:hypothetical protein
MRPLRTIVTYRNDQPGFGSSDWIADNFIFDAELPRSLFSTDPPAGYRLKNFGGAAGEAVPGIPMP